MKIYADQIIFCLFSPSMPSNMGPESSWLRLSKRAPGESVRVQGKGHATGYTRKRLKLKLNKQIFSQRSCEVLPLGPRPRKGQRGLMRRHGTNRETLSIKLGHFLCRTTHPQAILVQSCQLKAVPSDNYPGP